MRRSSFIASAAALALTARPVGSQALTSIHIASAPDEDIVGALWGVESGIFRRAGLDVTVQKANSGAAVGAAVAGGSIDIGKSSLFSLITAHVHGLPFVLLAPAGIYDTKAPIAAMVVGKSSTFKTAADLTGKTLSVSSLGDQNAIAMQAWIDQHGGDSKAVKFVELPSSAAPEALAAGRVDAATLGNPILSEAIQSGKCRLFAHSFDAIAPHFILAAYFCTADYAAAHRDTIARFRRAIAEAGNYADRHQSETVDVLARFTGISPAVISSMTRTLAGSVLDPKLVQPLIDIAARYKVIPAPFEAKTMFYEQA
ncbi:MAG TPA: ABC transporter substrate-binding protein [Candidatus Binatia bacterium]|nr:ABC transporter substrate-binding protein [Candidatus Binatia bacterium]